jgi:hypothetical protein
MGPEMTSLDLVRRPALSTEYASEGCVVLPHFVDPAVAAEWERRHRSLPGRRVHAGREFHGTWLEQKFADPTQALDGLAFEDWFLDLVMAITGMQAVEQKWTEVWTNRYRPGEHVPSHRDHSGNTQLLLCLQGLPEPEKGGEFVIRDRVVPLGTGDAVLFFASQIPHGTLPIGGTRIGPSGFARVTCVIRLYAPAIVEGAAS